MCTLRTSSVYNAHMAVIDTHANQCDVCKHIWLGDPNATHCASSKCRSRKWNLSFVDQAIEKARKVGAVAVQINDTVFPVHVDAPDQVSAKVQAVRDMNTRQTTGIYAKPAHAENCSCYSCRPPKAK